MTANEIARVQDYLRRIFENGKIFIDAPSKPGQPVEVRLGGEFIGVIYKDDEEGEVSYDLNISILDEDLPPAVSV